MLDAKAASASTVVDRIKPSLVIEVGGQKISELSADTTYAMKELQFNATAREGMRELQAGDVSLEYVSKLMNRRYTEGPTLRKILQTIWYQVNNGQEIYVIGVIQADGTVRGAGDAMNRR